jgi:hypothetical protein
LDSIFFVGVVGNTRDAALKAAIKEVIPGAEVIVEPVRISNGVATVVYQTQNGELVQATFDAFKVIYMIAGTWPGLQAMGIVGPPAQDCLQAALWLTQQAGQKLGTDLRTRILKCPEGRVLNGAGKCEPKPPTAQDPDEGASPVQGSELRVFGVDAVKAGGSSGPFRCGDALTLRVRIENPTSAPVDATIKVLLFLTNGQQQFGDEQHLPVPPGKQQATWTWTAPTDLYTYPYTFELAGSVQADGAPTGSRQSSPLTVECDR